MGLIEFNGEQHYHHITYFHPTRKEYIAARRRDKIKIDYCREKHILLLILTYQMTEEEIRALIRDFIDYRDINILRPTG